MDVSSFHCLFIFHLIHINIVLDPPRSREDSIITYIKHSNTRLITVCNLNLLRLQTFKPSLASAPRPGGTHFSNQELLKSSQNEEIKSSKPWLKHQMQNILCFRDEQINGSMPPYFKKNKTIVSHFDPSTARTVSHRSRGRPSPSIFRGTLCGAKHRISHGYLSKTHFLRDIR